MIAVGRSRLQTDLPHQLTVPRIAPQAVVRRIDLELDHRWVVRLKGFLEPSKCLIGIAQTDIQTSESNWVNALTLSLRLNDLQVSSKELLPSRGVKNLAKLFYDLRRLLAAHAHELQEMFDAFGVHLFLLVYGEKKKMRADIVWLQRKDVLELLQREVVLTGVVQKLSTYNAQVK